MKFHSFVFRVSYLLVLFLSNFLQCGEFEETAYTLSKQVEQGIGVMPDVLTETTSIRRTGEIEQRIIFEGHEQFRLQISFTLLDSSGKEQKATIQRRFSLDDFKEGGKRRFEVNHKLMTLSFQDPLFKWHIGFRSSGELTRATSLFDRLIKLREGSNALSSSLSQLAQQAGFKSLIICPIQANPHAMMKSLLSSSGSSFLAFLSRHTSDQEKELLEEAENHLPLLVYDLKRLDNSIFYTVSTLNERACLFYSTNKGNAQSILSDDPASFREELKMKQTCYIHFLKKPAFDTPKTLFYPPNELEQWTKALQEQSTPSHTNCIEVEPLFWNDRIPTGTDSFWLTARSPRSDDVLRFWFERGSFSTLPSVFSFVQFSYPNAERLLHQRSRYLKKGSVKEAIIKSFEQLNSLSSSLTKEQVKVLKVALVTHEMGSQLGSKEELAYNSIPFALMLSEKVGCTTQEQNMIELLLSSPPLFLNHESQDKENPSSFGLLISDAIQAAQKRLSPKSYLEVKSIFTQILLSLMDDKKQTVSFLHPFKPETLSSLCFGLLPLQGQHAGRKLYSSYLWEIRDPLHRDGLHIKRLREKYEQLILDHPDSPWKGKFWRWVDENTAKKPLSPTLYLSYDARERYQPVFKDGRLYTQEGQIIKEKEVMFVLDTSGRLYVGEKKDASSPSEYSFNHASFTCGEEIASSGKITVDGEGKPVLLRNMSGHYRPKIAETALALLTLKEAGVDLSLLLVSVQSDPVEKLPKMKGDKFLSLFQERIQKHF